MSSKENKLSEVSKRFIQVIDTMEYSAYRVAKETGEISQPVITHIRKGRNEPGLKAISALLKLFPQVSSSWLLTGRGTMLLNTDQGSEELHDSNMEDLKKLLNAKDRIIALQEEKIKVLEQGERKSIEAIQEALKPYFKTVLKNQDIIAGGLGKIILDIDDVTNENERKNHHHH